MRRLAALALLLAACGAPAEEDISGGDSALGEDAYKAYADLAGIEPDASHAVVVGLRGVSFDGTSHATTYAHAFDDVLVVLTTDKRAVRFRASTHPFQNAASGVPDVDGD